MQFSAGSAAVAAGSSWFLGLADPIVASGCGSVEALDSGLMLVAGSLLEA